MTLFYLGEGSSLAGWERRDGSKWLFLHLFNQAGALQVLKTCNPGCCVVVNVCYILYACMLTDVNECQDSGGICEGGACVNTDGGFICECPDGFVLSQNGMRCIDVRKDMCFDDLHMGQSFVRFSFITFYQPLVQNRGYNKLQLSWLYE